VPIFKPKILFYEKDPLLGIKYNRTLDNFFRGCKWGKNDHRRAILLWTIAQHSRQSSSTTWTSQRTNHPHTTSKECSHNKKRERRAGVANIGLEVKNRFALVYEWESTDRCNAYDNMKYTRLLILLSILSWLLHNGSSSPRYRSCQFQ
jgi:hypothetical protein